MDDNFKRIESYVLLLKKNITNDVNESELKQGHLMALDSVLSQIHFLKTGSYDATKS